MAVLSWYSLMLICMKDFSLPKKYLAIFLAVYVLPTLVGPTKKKLHRGLFGSFKPTLAQDKTFVIFSKFSDCPKISFSILDLKFEKMFRSTEIESSESPLF